MVREFAFKRMLRDRLRNTVAGKRVIIPRVLEYPFTREIYIAYE